MLHLVTINIKSFWMGEETFLKRNEIAGESKERYRMNQMKKTNWN